MPLGAFRTWVKYVEKGAFPETRRYFSVLRCNHCDDAPCVTICPTVALYRRDDGIVDFDGARCIGCKSCMQACPYDALYIDPATHTAAKCNYCAHRIEVGLEPACVIVCPEQAIIAGDLDDPALADRAPRRRASRCRCARRSRGRGRRSSTSAPTRPRSTPELQRPTPSTCGAQRPRRGGRPRPDGGRRAGAGTTHGDGTLSRTVYDAPHMPRPWGRKVAAYLWTKSIAAGALLVAALGALLGVRAGDSSCGVAAPLIALAVPGHHDRPARAATSSGPTASTTSCSKGNRRSWLVWGGVDPDGLRRRGRRCGSWAALTGNDALLRRLALPAIAARRRRRRATARFCSARPRGATSGRARCCCRSCSSAALAAGAASLLARARWCRAPTRARPARSPAPAAVAARRRRLCSSPSCFGIARERRRRARGAPHHARAVERPLLGRRRSSWASWCRWRSCGWRPALAVLARPPRARRALGLRGSVGQGRAVHSPELRSQP